MRLVAWILTIVLLVGAALSGVRLWQGMTTPPPDLPPLALAPGTGEAQPPEPPSPPPSWPPLFGRYQKPEPQPPAPPPPAPEPQPPQPPLPPLDSLGYTVTGMIRTGDGSGDGTGGSVWAMVSHPTGAVILREGDRLGEDMRVVRIDNDGVWLDRGRGDPELLAFEE
ncbi:hypothetical protein [Shimia biformata]|uniref:hypothetical protein n=1 Tax=Shimia biformata TaxID=1294299 RepID=UPI00194E4B28|nr:hypothetical protein [Shimia biformata]